MAQQVIAPVVPNIGLQGEAVAGSSGVIFTATDRKIIQERTGEINKNRSFIDILKERAVTPKVENEQTTTYHEPDVKELQGRAREHRRMLKNSPLTRPIEKVTTSNEIELPEVNLTESLPVLEAKATVEDNTKAKPNQDAELRQETVQIAKELRLNPSELFDKLSLQQKELFGLVIRIKELHLKRLLSETYDEFESYSEKIKKEAMSLAKPEAQKWLEAQLDQLTYFSAEYKLNLMQSLQSMEFNAKREKTIQWLKKIVDHFSSNPN